MKISSLFSGAGGFDLGLRQVRLCRCYWLAAFLVNFYNCFPPSLKLDNTPSYMVFLYWKEKQLIVANTSSSKADKGGKWHLQIMHALIWHCATTLTQLCIECHCIYSNKNRIDHIFISGKAHMAKSNLLDCISWPWLQKHIVLLAKEDSLFKFSIRGSIVSLQAGHEIILQCEIDTGAQQATTLFHLLKLQKIEVYIHHFSAECEVGSSCV